MAKYQYRVAGVFNWMSNSGNAIVALMNQPGSGKKITIRSLEITNLTYANNVTAGTVTSTLPTILRVERDATVNAESGARVPVLAMDSDAGALSSDFSIQTNTNVTAAGVIVGRATVAKQQILGSTAWFGQQRTTNRFGGMRLGPKRGGSSPVENYLVRPGQSLAVYPLSGIDVPVPVRVQGTIVKTGSPDRTYVVNYFTHIIANNVAILSVVNNHSTNSIKLIDFSVTEVGTFDSPYFQVVPVGSLDAVSAGDTAVQIAPLKMDTNYPDPTTWAKAYSDVAILPFGQPESALSDASAGSPKGSNYLKAKDFIGPQYRAYFPEHAGYSTIRLPDSLGHSLGHANTDLGMRRANVVIREGEGIALVSAAETAAGANPAGMSGWSSWHIAIQYDIEPKYAPTLTITGLKNPSEIRIFDAGTTTEIAGQETITSGTFTWQFDPEEYPSVDISIISLSYQNIRLLGQALTLADLTIPVQQQVDRQYGNA